MYNINSILRCYSDDMILKDFLNSKEFLLDLIKEIRESKNLYFVNSKGCRYCDSNNDCWYNMPDSKLRCVGYSNCNNYEQKGIKETEEAYTKQV